MSFDGGLRTIFSEIRGGEVAPKELANFLSTRSGSGSMAPGGTIVVYGADEETGIHGVYEDGQIVDIRVGPNVTESSVSRLRDEVQSALIDSPGDTISNQICFTNSRRVLGWWRYSDQFQFGPPPAGAPVPRMEWAKHPFLLQFRYRQSTNSIVDASRRSDAARELELLLNSLLNISIELSNRSVERFWVWPPHEEDRTEPPQSNYCQLGYVFPDFEGNSDHLDFPDGAIALAERDPQLYYGQFLPTNPDVTVPSDLSDAINRFYELSMSDKEKFLRASYWYQFADRTFQTSQTAGFLALINAVEALVVHQSGGEHCPCCNKEMEGPTARFRDFLERFAPMPGDDARRVRNQLYRLRSDISHGDLIFDTDSGGVNWGLAPAVREERHQHQLASTIVEVALNNWLRGERQEAALC